MIKVTINIHEIFKKACVDYFTELDKLFSRCEDYKKDPCRFFSDSQFIVQACKRELHIITEYTTNAITEIIQDTSKYMTSEDENIVVLPLFGSLDDLFTTTMRDLTRMVKNVSDGIEDYEKLRDSCISADIFDICISIYQIYKSPEILPRLLPLISRHVTEEYRERMKQSYDDKFAKADETSIFDMLKNHAYTKAYTCDENITLQKFPLSFENSNQFVNAFMKCRVSNTIPIAVDGRTNFSKQEYEKVILLRILEKYACSSSGIKDTAMLYLLEKYLPHGDTPYFVYFNIQWLLDVYKNDANAIRDLIGSSGWLLQSMFYKKDDENLTCSVKHRALTLSIKIELLHVFNANMMEVFKLDRHAPTMHIFSKDFLIKTNNPEKEFYLINAIYQKYKEIIMPLFNDKINDLDGNDDTLLLFVQILIIWAHKANIIWEEYQDTDFVKELESIVSTECLALSSVVDLNSFTPYLTVKEEFFVMLTTTLSKSFRDKILDIINEKLSKEEICRKCFLYVVLKGYVSHNKLPKDEAFNQRVKYITSMRTPELVDMYRVFKLSEESVRDIYEKMIAAGKDPDIRAILQDISVLAKIKSIAIDAGNRGVFTGMSATGQIFYPLAQVVDPYYYYIAILSSLTF